MENLIEELGYTEKKTKNVSKYVPAPEVAPQFATIDTFTNCWSITSGGRRESGFGELPRELDCPIIDRTAMVQDRVLKIHRMFGVVIEDSDVARLIAEYLKYGGKLISKEDYYGRRE